MQATHCPQWGAICVIDKGLGTSYFGKVLNFFDFADTCGLLPASPSPITTPRTVLNPFSLPNWKYSSPAATAAMSTSRTLVRSSHLLSRACITTRATRPACLSINMPTLHRQLSLSARLLEINHSRKPMPIRKEPMTLATYQRNRAPSGTLSARSIAITSLPKRATRPEVEALLQSKGIELYVLMSIACRN
jgi:hypothetical protein